MFRRVHRVRGALHFIVERLPGYGPPLQEDLKGFRDELVKATVGASVAAVAGLIFACFLSIAVIVTFWATHARILAAWMVCILWGLLAIVGLAFARRAVSGPLPFKLTRQALERDYEHLKTEASEQ
jgi:uncharacterized membrane protein YqjE